MEPRKTLKGKRRINITRRTTNKVRRKELGPREGKIPRRGCLGEYKNQEWATRNDEHAEDW